MVRSLLLSIDIVTLLYVLVNVAYLRGLGYDALTRSDAVAADLLKRAWGPAGEKLISVMIAIAALTSVNGSMIVGARSNYALGQDWPVFRFLARWDQASGSPRVAMLVQGVIALALVIFGAFQNAGFKGRSEEHTSELQSHVNLVCRLLLEKKKVSSVVTCRSATSR